MLGLYPQSTDSKVLTSLKENKMDYVLSTIVISYIDKLDNDIQKLTYTKVEDIYPSLINTHHLMQTLKSNDSYIITGMEYELESIDFNSVDTEISNTVH